MVNGTSDYLLINSKLYRPQVTEHLVDRQRLVEHLHIRRQRPLTVVSAPAGYGKTTLITSWLEGMNWPCAWLSLDEYDDNQIVFLSYFIAAIQTIYPDIGQETKALLTAPSLPPPLVLARTLISELDQIASRFVLVLDDYHVVHQTAIHELVTELLRHPPRSLHLVIVTRRDPPLALSKLRARGQMTEIRLEELSFTPAETAGLLETMLGRSVSDTTAASLTQKTEGWITGLRLAILSLRHRENLDGLLSTLPDQLHYVTEYLVGEILSSLPPPMEHQVLCTAILDRFCSSLCEAIFGPEHEGDEVAVGGSHFLEWIVKANLFTVPLDGQGKWYRFHHLFQQLLQHRIELKLSLEEIAALHGRASRWYAENGLIDEALHHALKAGDHAAAAQLVEKNGRSLLDEDSWHTLETWMAQLPEHTIQERPKLLLAKAWVSFHRFALWAIPPLLEVIEAILDDGEATQQLWGEVDFFWGHHWLWQGQIGRSVGFLERALERIPKKHYLARGEAELFWGVASQMVGQEKVAVRSLNQWFYGEQAPHPGRQFKDLGALVFIHLLSGELTEATREAQRLHDLVANSNNVYMKAWASYLQGCICYCRNELEDASHHFAQTVERRYSVHTMAAIDSLAGLTLTYHAMGQPDSAQATLTLLLEFAQGMNDPTYLMIARSCQAHLSLLQGDLASASHWLKTIDRAHDASVMFYWIEVPQITQCRTLIAQGTKAGLQQAKVLLQACRQQNEFQHNTRQLIELLPLQALAYHKEGLVDEAFATLEQAVLLAQSGGFIRSLVEPGPELADILGQLRTQGVARDYVSQIMAPSPDNFLQNNSEDREADELRAKDRTLVGRRSKTPKLLEPLTNRETDVLSLLAQGLSDKEIARHLVISPGTVAQHNHKIYQKLMVSNRRQAAIKAAELGILP